MKIIQQGMWIKNVKCDICEAELLINENDVKIHPATQTYNDNETWYYYQCPCCSKDQKLVTSDIPDTVIRKKFQTLKR